MVRKNINPVETTPEHGSQGMLFNETVVGNGSTDAGSFETTSVLTPVEGGVFPETDQPKPEYDFSDPEIVKAVSEAVKTDNRSKAQRGKHTTLDEQGDHTKIYPGKYLPGFGPVTESNTRYARTHAENLDRKQ